MRRYLVFFVCFAGCTAPEGSTRLEGASDAAAAVPESLSSRIVVDAILQTTTDANLRDAPNPSSRVIRVVPRGANLIVAGAATPLGGFVSVSHDGLMGWMNGDYLAYISQPTVKSRKNVFVEPAPRDPDAETTPDHAPDHAPDTTSVPNDASPSEPAPPPVIDEDPTAAAADAIIARAQTGVGFSYWWGGGRWDPSGATPANRGSCSGACPDCTHTGVFGADCSGYVAKVWQVPATNTDPMKNSHPYSTATFVSSHREWFEVDRDTLERADALVYNDGRRGHIMLYDSGDPWGQLRVYEAKGCASGIVVNTRTVSTNYRAIRKN